MFGKISGINIYERDWSKFDGENYFILLYYLKLDKILFYFILFLDYFSVDWEDLLKIDERNVDNSTKMYLDKINMLFDT